MRCRATLTHEHRGTTSPLSVHSPSFPLSGRRVILRLSPAWVLHLPSQSHL
jgi:hypothetical protein